jgi:hypothetical protein
MDTKRLYYEKNAAAVIKNLEKRQIEGFYCKTSKEALERALTFIHDGDTVSFGGSMTLVDCGVIDELRNNKQITLWDRLAASNPEEREELDKKAFYADCYFMSTNAITLDGELLNIDGNGNRLAAMMFGPKMVVFMVGMNKVVTNIQAAYDRVKNIASPQNCIRLNRNTPCLNTGTCGDCLSDDCICSYTVVTRRNIKPGRMKVILIGEDLGY